MAVLGILASHVEARLPGVWFNIKMSSYQCRKSNCGDKTVIRSSYLHNGISYAGKMASLSWINLQQTFLYLLYFIYFLSVLQQLLDWATRKGLINRVLVNDCTKHVFVLVITTTLNSILLSFQPCFGLKLRKLSRWLCDTHPHWTYHSTSVIITILLVSKSGLPHSIAGMCPLLKSMYTCILWLIHLCSDRSFLFVFDTLRSSDTIWHQTSWSKLAGLMAWCWFAHCKPEKPWRIFQSSLFFMMTSSNGNIFRVTGHLCGAFTGPRWMPHTKASDAELWCLLWSTPE